MTNNQVITALLQQNFKTKLNSNFNTIDKYASDMRISSKKLQRLLNEEDTTFSAELNKYRMQTVYELLRKTKTPLSRVAHDLGYSSTEALNTACKRWFGCPPRSLRKEAVVEKNTNWPSGNSAQKLSTFGTSVEQIVC